MSAKKWREEQRKRQEIMLGDRLYIANVQAADLAMRNGRITSDMYRVVLDWNQRAALRRHEHRKDKVAA